MMTMILMMKMMMMKDDDDINDEWFPFLVNAAGNVDYSGRNAPTMDPALYHFCMFLILIVVFPFFLPLVQVSPGTGFHLLDAFPCAGYPLRRQVVAAPLWPFPCAGHTLRRHVVSDYPSLLLFLQLR